MVLATLFFAFSALASDRDALNGTWTLNPTRSDFAGQSAIQSGSVTISGSHGDFMVTRSFVYEGKGETVFYKDMIDSDQNIAIHSGKEIKTTAKWDHDALKVTTTGYGATTVESYALSGQGGMTATVVLPGRMPVTLVFERGAQ